MKNFQRFGLVWIVLSVAFIFFGLVFSSASVLTENENIGPFFLKTGGISAIAFFVTTIIYIVFSGSRDIIKVLATGYLVLCSLVFLVGLVYSFGSHPYGLTILFTSIGMFMAFWLVVLVYFIQKKEEKPE